MKIAFLGTPDFVQPIKEELSKHFTLVDNLKDADLAVIAAYGHILTKEELEMPKFGCINVHPSLLPKYRGPSPIQSAILKGDKVSGVSIIKMDEEIDHGPVIYTTKIILSPKDNFESLSKKMFLLAGSVLPKIIKDFLERKLKTVNQNHSKATFTPHLTKEDGYFDIDNPPTVEKLDKMIRAYFPWPGVWCKWSFGFAQDKKMKIVKLLPNQMIQMEGKKPISLKDFLNGYPDFPIKKFSE